MQTTSEAHYNQIIKAAGLGIWEWNYQTDHVKYNDIWFSQLGYEAKDDEVKDTAFWFKIIHPDDLRTSEKAIEKHIAGKTEFYQCELRLKHKNGHYIWIQDTGQVIKWTKNGAPLIVAGTHINIDKRKKNELLLTKYKDLLDKTNEAASIGTWEVDLLEDKLSWSTVTKKIHEVPSHLKPDVDTAIKFYKKGENRERIAQLFSKAIQNFEPYDDIFEIKTAKGKFKWVRSLGIPIKKDGKCTRVYGIFQDIH